MQRGILAMAILAGGVAGAIFAAGSVPHPTCVDGDSMCTLQKVYLAQAMKVVGGAALGYLLAALVVVRAPNAVKEHQAAQRRSQYKAASRAASANKTQVDARAARAAFESAQRPVGLPAAAMAAVAQQRVGPAHGYGGPAGPGARRMPPGVDGGLPPRPRGGMPQAPFAGAPGPGGLVGRPMAPDGVGSPAGLPAQALRAGHHPAAQGNGLPPQQGRGPGVPGGYPPGVPGGYGSGVPEGYGSPAGLPPQAFGGPPGGYAPPPNGVSPQGYGAGAEAFGPAGALPPQAFGGDPYGTPPQGARGPGQVPAAPPLGRGPGSAPAGALRPGAPANDPLGRDAETYARQADPWGRAAQAGLPAPAALGGGGGGMNAPAGLPAAALRAARAARPGQPAPRPQPRRGGGLNAPPGLPAAALRANQAARTGGLRARPPAQPSDSGQPRGLRARPTPPPGTFR